MQRRCSGSTKVAQNSKNKKCRHWESHPGYRRHKPRYCSYTIAAAGATPWRCRASIPDLNLAKVVCYHLQHTPGPCVRRDSNPNLMLGRHKYYPCTTDARQRAPEKTKTQKKNKNCRNKKKKHVKVPYSTRDSHVVPHRSTDRAQRRLTSQF